MTNEQWEYVSLAPFGYDGRLTYSSPTGDVIVHMIAGGPDHSASASLIGLLGGRGWEMVFMESGAIFFKRQVVQGRPVTEPILPMQSFGSEEWVRFQSKRQEDQLRVRREAEEERKHTDRIRREARQMLPPPEEEWPLANEDPGPSGLA